MSVLIYVSPLSKTDVRQAHALALAYLLPRDVNVQKSKQGETTLKMNVGSAAYQYHSVETPDVTAAFALIQAGGRAPSLYQDFMGEWIKAPGQSGHCV